MVDAAVVCIVEKEREKEQTMFVRNNESFNIFAESMLQQSLIEKEEKMVPLELQEDIYCITFIKLLKLKGEHEVIRNCY